MSAAEALSRSSVSETTPNSVLHNMERQRFLKPGTPVSAFRKTNVKYQNLNRDHFILLQDLKQTNFMGKGWSRSTSPQFGDHYAHFVTKDGIEHAVIVTVHEKKNGVLAQWNHVDFDQAHEVHKLKASNALHDDMSANYVYMVHSASGSESTTLSFDTSTTVGLATTLGAVIIGAIAKIIKDAVSAAAAIEASAYVSFEETGVLALMKVTAAQAATLTLSVLAIAGILLLYFLQKQLGLAFSINNFTTKYIEITDQYFYNIEKQDPGQPYLAPPHEREVEGAKYLQYDAIDVNVHNDSQYRGIGVAFVLHDKVLDNFCAFVMRCDYNGNKVINMQPTSLSSAEKAFEDMSDSSGFDSNVIWNDMVVSLTIRDKQDTLCAGTFTIEEANNVT
jgi:hypothetical protein